MSLPYTIALFIVLTRSIFELRICSQTFDPTEETNAQDSDGTDPPEVAGDPLSGTLAGLPRHILESERLDRGALLRDTLLQRPSSRDD